MKFHQIGKEMRKKMTIFIEKYQNYFKIKPLKDLNDARTSEAIIKDVIIDVPSGLNEDDILENILNGMYEEEKSASPKKTIDKNDCISAEFIAFKYGFLKSDCYSISKENYIIDLVAKTSPTIAPSELTEPCLKGRAELKKQAQEEKMKKHSQIVDLTDENVNAENMLRHERGSFYVQTNSVDVQLKGIEMAVKYGALTAEQGGMEVKRLLGEQQAFTNSYQETKLTFEAQINARRSAFQDLRLPVSKKIKLETPSKISFTNFCTSSTSNNDLKNVEVKTTDTMSKYIIAGDDVN
jgi:hypothetical protein